jgi:hypothetical protein
MAVLVPVATKRGSRDLVVLFAGLLAALWLLFVMFGDADADIVHTEV